MRSLPHLYSWHAQLRAAEGDSRGTIEYLGKAREVHREIGERLTREGVFSFAEP